jgi:hypothetical protein
MVSASIEMASSSLGRLASDRASLAKETSDRARMLSTRVKSIRDMMTKDLYQLGSNHSSSQAEAKIDEPDDIDDIDDTEVDLEDDPSSSNEFDGDTDEHPEPFREGKSKGCCKPTSPGNPASVIENHEMTLRAEENVLVATSSHSRRTERKATRGSIRRTSKGSPKQKTRPSSDAVHKVRSALQIDKTTREMRAQRHSVHGLFVGASTDDVIAKPTGTVRRQNRRRSTGTLACDDDAEAFKLGPPRHREQGSIHRRRILGRPARAENNNNVETSGKEKPCTKDAGRCKDPKSRKHDDGNCLVRSAGDRSMTRQDRRGSTGTMTSYDTVDPSSSERPPRSIQGSNHISSLKGRRAKSELANNMDDWNSEAPACTEDTGGSKDSTSSTGVTVENLDMTCVEEEKAGECQKKVHGKQPDEVKKVVAGLTKSLSERRRQPGLKQRKARSAGLLEAGSMRSKQPFPRDAGGSNDLKSSTLDDRKDAAHKSRSRFVTQRSFEVATINRRSRSLRNLLGESSTSDTHLHVGGQSGSISSLTLSTCLASKSDFSYSSEAKEALQRAKTDSGIATAAGQERRLATLSRWTSNPQNSTSTSADGVPTRPEQDLSSICSPGVLSNKEAVACNPRLKAKPPLPLSQAPPERRLCALSGYGQVTPSTLSKGLNCLQSLSLEDRNFRGSSRSKLHPEIVIPCRPLGYASDFSTTGGIVSALTTTPRSDASSQSDSLQSRLRKVSARTDLPLGMGVPSTPGGFVSELTTPHTVRARVPLDVPTTPALSIGPSDLGTQRGCGIELTPGVVSELTFADSYMSRDSFRSSRHRNALDIWMTNVQRVMLQEGEYNRDGAPKMVRRYSLDSVSFVAEAPIHTESRRRDPSLAKESDFAPKVPSRQASVASKTFPHK